MFNIDLDLIGSVLQSIPSKKNLSINKKIKLLRQEEWYKEIVNKYGNLFIFNNAFRDFIYRNDIVNILKDKGHCQVLKEQIIQLLIKENL